jgi:hypothetical protein
VYVSVDNCGSRFVSTKIIPSKMTTYDRGIQRKALNLWRLPMHWTDTRKGLCGEKATKGCVKYLLKCSHPIEKRKCPLSWHRPAVANGSLGSRVTRLGWFSPIGLSLLSAIFYKITEVAQMFGQLIPTVLVLRQFWQKWVGLHFGQFIFKNSSGHPDRPGKECKLALTQMNRP